MEVVPCMERYACDPAAYNFAACTKTNAMCPQIAYNGGDTLQQGSTFNAPGKIAANSSSENMANSSGTSQRAPSSEALRSSSSASSLALQGPVEGATRGGQAESSGRGWADLSGDMQQRLNLGQGQQTRRSSDNFASIPRVYSNERLAPGVLDASLHLLVGVAAALTVPTVCFFLLCCARS